MKVAITGPSGMIGSALAASLRADGHEMVRLVRRPPQSAEEVRWDPQAADGPSTRANWPGSTPA
jgi:NAD dependent epimerase/dehydratase family enzyme